MEILSIKGGFNPNNEKILKNKLENAWYIIRLLTECYYKKDGVMVKCNDDHLLIFPPNTEVYIEAVNADADLYLGEYVCFESQTFYTVLEKYPLPICEPINVDASIIMDDMITAIERELALKLNGYEDKIENILINFIIDLKNMNDVCNADNYYGELCDARFEILNEYSEDWTLEQMASICEYSVSRFSALYQKYFKISPVNDLIKFRVNKAKEFMLYGGYSVTKACKAVGFNSIQYFSKQFKKIIGVPPSKFVKK